MSLKPCSLKLRAAYSRTCSNAASGTLIVPGKRMWPDGGLKLPSGTYAITGATIALPNETAIRSESNLTRRLCFPRAMAGPLCSVPPIGTMMVVLPVAISSRSSVHVSSSRKIEGRSCRSESAGRASEVCERVTTRWPHMGKLLSIWGPDLRARRFSRSSIYGPELTQHEPARLRARSTSHSAAARTAAP